MPAEPAAWKGRATEARGRKTVETSMNRPSPGLRPPSPRLAGRGQGEGCQSGSWPQCVRKSERRLSMKRNGEHSLASERAGQIEGNQGGHFPSAFSRRCQTEESNQVRRVEFHAAAGSRFQNRRINVQPAGFFFCFVKGLQHQPRAGFLPG